MEHLIPSAKSLDKAIQFLSLFIFIIFAASCQLISSHSLGACPNGKKTEPPRYRPVSGSTKDLQKQDSTPSGDTPRMLPPGLWRERSVRPIDLDFEELKDFVFNDDHLCPTYSEYGHPGGDDHRLILPIIRSCLTKNTMTKALLLACFKKLFQQPNFPLSSGEKGKGGIRLMELMMANPFKLEKSDEEQFQNIFAPVNKEKDQWERVIPEVFYCVAQGSKYQISTLHKMFYTLSDGLSRWCRDYDDFKKLVHDSYLEKSELTALGCTNTLAMLEQLEHLVAPTKIAVHKQLDGLLPQTLTNELLSFCLPEVMYRWLGRLIRDTNSLQERTNLNQALCVDAPGQG